MEKPEIVVLDDSAAVAMECARRIIAQGNALLARQGRFSVALAGGSTPKAVYEVLATPDNQSKLDWSRVDVWFGDERCVPPDHADSNFRMAEHALLSKLLNKPVIHRMVGENDPNDGAKKYGQDLKAAYGDAGLDLVLLGMGDDGHTASLFPGTPALDETGHRCVAQFVEKSTTGRSWRITLTAPFINRSRSVIVCVTGAGKADRIVEVLTGPHDPKRLPIQLIRPDGGTMTWLLDRAAAARLPALPKHQ